MTHRKAVFFVAILAAGLTLSSGDSPAVPSQKSPLVGWTRLRLEASKFLIASAESVVERWTGNPTEEPDLIRVSNVMRYLGQVRAKDGFSLRSAPGGTPSRWMELEPGKSAREAVVGSDGGFRLRRFGIPSGKSEPWSGPWAEGKTERKQLTLEPSPENCLGPVDVWGIFGRLHCLSNAETMPLQLLNNDGLVKVTARRKGVRKVQLLVADLETGHSRTMEVEEILVELLPAPGEPDPGVFGLDSGVVLGIDPASGALLEIQGKRQKIPGSITFRLTGVSFLGRPRPPIPWPSESKSSTYLPAP